MICPAIQLMLVDDHYVVRMGLRAILQFEPGIQVIAEANDGAEAIELFDRHTPDVTLMDLRMPRMNGVETLIQIRSRHPEARVVMFTTYDGDEDVHRALKAGAAGYLMKNGSSQELVDTIRGVYAGRRCISNSAAKRLAERAGAPNLTAREVEVLELISKGFRNREIGTMLQVTEHTAKAHVKNILEKLDAADRTEAVGVALQRGILHIE